MDVAEGVDAVVAEILVEHVVVNVVEKVAEDVDDDADSTNDWLSNSAPPRKDWKTPQEASRTSRQFGRSSVVHSQIVEVHNLSVADRFHLLHVIRLSFCSGLPLHRNIQTERFGFSYHLISNTV